MKKSDIAMIILIASVSVMISYFIANSIPALKPSEQGVAVPVVDKYQESFEPKPSEKYFNADAINPTVQTIIGEEGAAAQ